MIRNRRLPIGALLSVLATASVLADKVADLKPTLAVPTTSTFADKFDAAQLAKSWRINKGDWQVKDGTVVGKEKKEDHHPAVLFLPIPNHNSVLRVSFKFDGAQRFVLSYNYAKGHLFRLTLNSTGLLLMRDRDKDDTSSKPLATSKAAGKFEPGQWYTLLVEVQGGKVSARTDNGLSVEITDPGIDVDKPGYAFVTAGETLALAGVTVWKLER